MNTVKYEKLTLELDDTNDSYMVTDCEKDAVSVIIPMKVGEKYVTGIADYAFEACASLISVQLPDFDDEAYLNGYEFDTPGEYAFPAWISATASAAGTERTDRIC